MMNDPFEAMASRAAAAVRDWVAEHGDPDTDLADVVGSAVPLLAEREQPRRNPWPWLVAAAAAAILIVALVLQAGNGSETIVDPAPRSPPPRSPRRPHRRRPRP